MNNFHLVALLVSSRLISKLITRAAITQVRPVVKGIKEFAKGQELDVSHKIYGATLQSSKVTLRAKEVVLDRLWWTLLTALLPRFCTYFAEPV